MFSLSYLPTAERLTVVVVKARNLKFQNQNSGEPFVKVIYIFHHIQFYRNYVNYANYDQYKYLKIKIKFKIFENKYGINFLIYTVLQNYGELFTLFFIF